MGKIKMKKLFKLGCLGLMGLVALIVIVAVASGGGETNSTDNQAADTKPAETKKEKKNVVTKENFDKIKQGESFSGEGGMTIEEVTEILGKPDQTTEAQSGDMKMEDYTWISGFLGDAINVNFINGKVASKSWVPVE
jgi:hypothetical protein